MRGELSGSADRPRRGYSRRRHGVPLFASSADVLCGRGPDPVSRNRRVPRDPDVFPQIDILVVTVIWSYTGLSTPEMEQRVTTYSQYAISSNVNGIKDIEAQTMAGLSVQKIYFQPDVNLDLADRNLPRPAKGIT
jgi:hypothetical protein